MPRLLPLLLLFFLLVPPRLLALGGTGAPPIDESAITVTLHVSPTAPAGGNGTPAAPFNTVQAALTRAVSTHNAANQGVRVLLAPGTYREGAPGANNAITFPTPTTAAPIIVEGAGWNPAAPASTGDVILSGSENWSGGWTSLGNGTWTRPWPYDWGVGPNNTGGGNPPEAMLRYELVHVNGATYYQMLGPADPNLAHLTAAEGAFWVSESTNLLTIRPPASVPDLNAALVEVTTRRRLLHHWRPQANTSPTPVVLRNLVFQHAASGLNSGAVYLQNLIGLHIEDCVFRDNKQMGVSIVGIHSTFTVRRTEVVRNGEMGSGFQGVNILAEDVRWSDNARFADVIKYYGWGYGGIKIGASSHLTFRRVEAARNYGMGLWFDTANVNCLVTDSVIVDNTSQGVWSENNNRNNLPALGDTPTVVLRRVYLAGNYKRSPQATVLGGGFYLTESENTRIEHSVLFDNPIQFRISDGPGRGPVANTTVRSSVLASRRGQVQRLYATGYGTTGWQQFFDTLSAETGNNDYYYSGSADGVTALSPQPQPASTLAFYTRDQQLTRTLAQWKTLHAARAADQDSRWITTYAGQPLVVLEAAAPYRQETGGTVTGFRIRRVDRDLSVPLTVRLVASGTAQPGVHYQPFPDFVLIPSGAREVEVPFSPLLSGQAYGEVSVTLSASADPDYVAPEPSAGFLLEDAASAGQPRVSVMAATPAASEEGPASAVLVFARTGATDAPLTVAYSVAGSASPARYQPLSGSFHFPAGADTAELIVTPLDDAMPQLTQSVVVTLLPGPGYVPSLGLPTSATVLLHDNDIASPVAATAALGDAAFAVPVTLHNPGSVAQTFTVALPANLADPYQWSDSTQLGGPDYSWTDIHALPGVTEITELRNVDDQTTQFANGQSGAIGGIPLGFTFPYFSSHYSELWLNSNGVIDLGARGAGGRWTNQPLPVTSSYLSPNNTTAHLLFFWDDLRLVETAPAARAYYARPDARTFVLTLENYRHYSNYSLRLDAQVILKSSGEILVNYRQVSIPYNLGSTIGLQGTIAEGRPHVQVSYNSDYVQSGMSLRFRRSVPWLSGSANTFQVIVPASSSAAFALVLDPASLPLGLHSATLQITSDHPDQPALALPVSLAVSEIFTPPSPPLAPTDLAATPLDDRSIALNWVHSGPAPSGFRLERSVGVSGAWSPVATLGPASPSHQDTGLSPSTTYAYRVFAFNAGGDSPASPVAHTSTLASDLLVDDSFADGGVTAGDDPRDSAWIATGGTFSVVPDPTLDPASPHHVAQLSIATAAKDEYLSFALPSTVVLGVGETLAVSFKLRHTGAPRADAFRTGVSLASVPGTAPWANTANRDYFFFTSYGASGTSGSIRKNAGGVQVLNNSSSTVTLASGLASTDAGTEVLAVSFEAFRSGENTLRLRYRLGDGPAQEAIDAADILTAFNRIFIRLYTRADAASPAFRIDRIRVERIAPALAPPPTPLELWRATHFTLDELLDPALEATRWGHTADPDADGLANLLEYALALDPASPSVPDYQLQMTNDHLRLTFTPHRSELTYEVLASSDLLAWDVIATDPGQVGSAQPVTVQDPVPVSTSSRRFLRLRVSP